MQSIYETLKSLPNENNNYKMLIKYSYIAKLLLFNFALKMLKFLLICFLICGSISCNSTENNDDLYLIPDNNFPQWLMYNSYAAAQTSGIAFISTDADGNKNFLLADDIGKLHHLKIKDDKITSITPVYFSEEVEKVFSGFPKLDIEDILYDRKTGSTFISIEGNGNNYINYAGIFQIIFAHDDVLSDTILSVKKTDITPEDIFTKYLDRNIGYEGITADDNYLYLGLEGFTTQGMFADSTIIFVVDKSSLRIVKEINTKHYGIQTICGLFADSNYSVYGIDRNNKKLFHLILNNDLNIENFDTVTVKTHIPNYNSFNYVSSLESITMDDEKNIYMIDDPWTTYYVPSDDILNQLDENTVRNFKKFVPVIYKFKLKN